MLTLIVSLCVMVLHFAWCADGAADDAYGKELVTEALARTKDPLEVEFISYPFLK